MDTEVSNKKDNSNRHGLYYSISDFCNSFFKIYLISLVQIIVCLQGSSSFEFYYTKARLIKITTWKLFLEDISWLKHKQSICVYVCIVFDSGRYLCY